MQHSTGMSVSRSLLRTKLVRSSLYLFPKTRSLTQNPITGYVKSYIILPSTIYGRVKNPLVDAGIQNPQSIQIPYLIKAALGRKQAGMVGKGVALWADVSNDDSKFLLKMIPDRNSLDFLVADLYIALYDAIAANPDKVGHGIEGYYYGENGEHTWYSISRAIGEALVDLGVSKDPEPTSFTDDELIKYYGSLVCLASTSIYMIIA